MRNSREQDLQFEALLEFLHRDRGPDFRSYNRPDLMRRINQRIHEVGLSEYEDYLDYLEVHPEEFTPLFNAILINVTSFFRDPQAWHYLTDEIIPTILQAKNADQPLRIWSAACASGEEVYTVAMLLVEALGVDAFRRRVKIYATDIDQDAVSLARQATYTAQDLEPVASELTKKYFERVGSRYVFRADLRRFIISGRHDLLQDAPISRLDLLLCRKTLMYFNAEAQDRVLARFNYALNDGGFLFLGNEETLSSHDGLFTPTDPKNRIFTKVSQFDVIGGAAVSDESADWRRRQSYLQEAFNVAPSPQVIVDFEGKLAHANRRAVTLLGVTSKDIDKPLQDLEIFCQSELRSLIERAYAERKSVAATNAVERSKDGHVQYLEVEAVALWDRQGQPKGVSITFNDVSRYHQLKAELQFVRDEMREANEMFKASGERIEATNKRLQTTNQQLYSANERLEAANEALQSINEELQSANEELQTTNQQLTNANQALRQDEERFRLLVESVSDYAIFMLNPDGVVISWNLGAEQIKGYRPHEIIGQHFSRFYNSEDLQRGKPQEGLKRAAADGRFEDEGWRVRKDGSQFWASVVITALRDGSGQLRGFAKVARDFTERRQAEQSLRESEARLEMIMNNSPSLIFLKDSEGRYLYSNSGFERITHKTAAEIVGKSDFELFSQEQAAAFRANDLKVLETGELIEFEETALGDDGPRTSIVAKFPLKDAAGNVYALCGIATDITMRKKTEEHLQRNLRRITALHDINAAIGSTLDLQKVLELLLVKLESSVLYPTASTIRLFNRQTGALEHLVCRNIKQEEWHIIRQSSPGRRGTAVMQSKLPLVVRNVQTDPRSQSPGFYTSNGLVSYAAAPLLIGDVVLGILCLYSKQEHEFSTDEIEFLSGVAVQAALAINNSRLYGQIKTQAAELQKARDELELRVRKRTDELAKANEDLKVEVERHERAAE